MAEEKLIETLWAKYHAGTNASGVLSGNFDAAIHEALAAKGRGCADAFYSFDPQPLQLDGDDKRLGDAIFNAEPLEEI